MDFGWNFQSSASSFTVRCFEVVILMMFSLWDDKSQLKWQIPFECIYNLCRNYCIMVISTLDVWSLALMVQSHLLTVSRCTIYDWNLLP